MTGRDGGVHSSIAELTVPPYTMRLACLGRTDQQQVSKVTWQETASPPHTNISNCKGGNDISAGWQVTLCYPIWHASSRSGEASSELLYSVYAYLRTTDRAVLAILQTHVWRNIPFYAAFQLYNRAKQGS